MKTITIPWLFYPLVLFVITALSACSITQDIEPAEIEL